MALGLSGRIGLNGRTGLRVALASGVATALLVAAGEPADAQFRWFDRGYYAPEPQPVPQVRRKRATTAPVQRIATPNKVIPGLVKGPLTLVVSLKEQKVTAYANGEEVGRSPISSGVPSNPTPYGVFSILQKNRHHRSNIYSGAPMPYMQRLTWSGIALHQGVLPGHPASHGCIRLPQDFAARLWEITELGVRVVITHEDVSPVTLTHQRLFALKQRTATQPVALRGSDPAQKIRLAQVAEKADTAAPAAEPEIPGANVIAIEDGAALTDAIRSEVAKPAAAAPAPAAPAAEPATAAPVETAKVTPAPAKTFETAKAVPEVAPEADKLDLDKLKPGTSAKDVPLKPGPITVFISRATGKLYVRKGFWPVFEAPVTIAEPTKPFGTHVFTALEPVGDKGALRWTVVSMPNDARKKTGWMSKAERAAMVAAGPDMVPPANPSDVLNRITIPDETMDRISSFMTTGASLIVSDLSMSHETTPRGSDFILLTR